MSTVPQTFLDGYSRSIPQGRALGGGTLLNGMLWNRGGRSDFDDWSRLGNHGWAWDDMLPYFRKSETYSPIQSSDIATDYSIGEDTNVHGYAGPVNVSFPHYYWNSSINLFSALTELGVPTAYDPNAGDIAGASFLPFGLDPVTQTRCTARRAYYDPVANRPNLWVTTGQTVTQILFDGAQGNANASAPSVSDFSTGEGGSPATVDIFGGGSMLNTSTIPPDPPNEQKRDLARKVWHWLKTITSILRRQAPGPGPSLVATGVEFAPDAQGVRQVIQATREVILAAGAIHTPQIMKLSGLGPTDELQSLGIQPLMHLPGVGNNLQDHMQVWCWYPYHNEWTINPTELNTNQTFVNEAVSSSTTYPQDLQNPWLTSYLTVEQLLDQ